MDEANKKIISNYTFHTQIIKNWKFYDVPAAPSRNGAEIIQNFIGKQGKEPKILILGATPQYRDLAHRLKAKVTCIDLSLPMLIAMINFMEYPKEADREVWVRDSWVNMNLEKGFFVFVVAVLPIPNLPLELQQKMMQRVKYVLKSGGYFIPREWNGAVIKKKPEDIIEEFLNVGKTDPHTMYTFLWDFLDFVHNHQDYTAKSGDIAVVIEGLWKKEKDKKRKAKIKKLLDHAKTTYPAGKTWWNLLEPQKEELFKKYFVIEGKEFANDYQHTKECPIYFLKNN